LKGLPVPGLYTDAGAFYKQGKLDEAEYEYKKVLHHLPEHAAANFMVGVIYNLKGHPKMAIEQMEKGVEKCPWNRQWRDYLVDVCRQVGDNERVEKWKKGRGQPGEEAINDALDTATQGLTRLANLSVSAL
jgi:predicted Zn-dependent protease